MKGKQITRLLSAVVLYAVVLCADTVNYKYDDAGRLTAVSYPDGTSIAYTYDNAGNMLARTVTPPAAQTSPQSKKQTAVSKTAKDRKVRKPSN